MYGNFYKHQNKIINRNVERKNKTRQGKKKEEKKTHTEEGKKNGRLIFLLSVGDKPEILKLTFNTLNCLMKHNNLSCQFGGNLGLEKMCSGENFQSLNIFCIPVFYFVLFHCMVWKVSRSKNKSIITHACWGSYKEQIDRFIYLLHNLYMRNIK